MRFACRLTVRCRHGVVVEVWPGGVTAEEAAATGRAVVQVLREGMAARRWRSGPFPVVLSSTVDEREAVVNAREIVSIELGPARERSG